MGRNATRCSIFQLFLWKKCGHAVRDLPDEVPYLGISRRNLRIKWQNYFGECNGVYNKQLFNGILPQNRHSSCYFHSHADNFMKLAILVASIWQVLVHMRAVLGMAFGQRVIDNRDCRVCHYVRVLWTGLFTRSADQWAMGIKWFE